jgi:hypothetical protein
MPRQKKQIIWVHYITNANNKSIKCKYCQTTYSVPNVNKMERHLKKCLKCPRAIKYKIFGSSKNNERELTTNETLLEFVSTPALQKPDEKGSSLGLLISKAIFASGAPISMVEHPLWIKVFKKLQPQYKLPSQKQIATNYLDIIHNQMEKDISEDLKRVNSLHL